jgi:hypothetical protein
MMVWPSIKPWAGVLVTFMQACNPLGQPQGHHAMLSRLYGPCSACLALALRARCAPMIGDEAAASALSISYEWIRGALAVEAAPAREG